MIRTAQKWLRRHPKTSGTVGAAVLTLVVASTVGVTPQLRGGGAHTSTRTHTADVARPRAGRPEVRESVKSQKSEKWKKSHQSHSAPPPEAHRNAEAARRHHGTGARDATDTGPARTHRRGSPPRRCSGPRRAPDTYPLHTGIVATTFWVGEIFDPNAEDGSQMLSTYDANWFANFGGCDGCHGQGVCQTEKRVASNDYFPSRMTPKQNPFYLDLPYDDINDLDRLHEPWHGHSVGKRPRVRTAQRRTPRSAS